MSHLICVERGSSASRVAHLQPMIKRRTAEEWLAEVEAIIRGYRAGRAEAGTSLALRHDEAIARLRHLGITAGDAERWLAGSRRN